MTLRTLSALSEGQFVLLQMALTPPLNPYSASEDLMEEEMAKTVKFSFKNVFYYFISYICTHI